MNADASWAVITGASSGIGKALAVEFARGGFHVVLTGRNEAALSRIAEECSRNFGVETVVVAVDLSDPGGTDDLIAALSSEPRRYEALVNNAGFGVVGDFASSPIDENISLVQLQLTAALKLTHALLPAMIRRHSGRILNVASVYSFSPVPFQSVYAASKAFLMSFSRSLEKELEGSGVTVTLCCPGVTQTEFRHRAGVPERSAASGMTAEAVARVAFAETMRGKHVVVPGLANRLFVLAARLLPPGLTAGVIRFVNRRRGHVH